jgi:hypothetical protein
MTIVLVIIFLIIAVDYTRLEQRNRDLTARIDELENVKKANLTNIFW